MEPRANPRPRRRGRDDPDHLVRREGPRDAPGWSGDSRNSLRRRSPAEPTDLSLVASLRVCGGSLCAGTRDEGRRHPLSEPLRRRLPPVAAPTAHRRHDARHPPRRLCRGRAGQTHRRGRLGPPPGPPPTSRRDPEHPAGAEATETGRGDCPGESTRRENPSGRRSTGPSGPNHPEWHRPERFSARRSCRRAVEIGPARRRSRPVIRRPNREVERSPSARRPRVGPTRPGAPRRG